MSAFRTVFLLFAFSLSSTLLAQPRARVTDRIDPSRVLRLANTTHPLTRGATDLGRVNGDLPMERILLQLTSSGAQLAELDALLADQQDPASARFQQWLTPDEFGERFGAAAEDVAAVTNWLRENGFTAVEVGHGRRTLEFSGTARQVETAFHTEMHRYRVDGEVHVGNATDLGIPEALAPLIGGVASLHDFRHKPMHRVLSTTPLTNLTGGAHSLSPYDFATIYNVTRLWNGNWDGTGQAVAITGRTNIKMSDVASFRSMFGLPGNNTQIILNGRDPGIVSAGEETEADLDVEWSGAVAKGAPIKFVVSASTNASDGVDLSSQYIVNNNVAPVMSVSFGACEAALGGSNGFYSSLWQQAAAQGISVFISSGDSGSAGCDPPSVRTPASRGLGVNGLGSTPNNVAVGGTQFADTGNPAAYWGASNDSHLASATGYIPETTWNESSYTSANASSNNLFATGGGVSTIYATPAWQTGKGVPAADPASATAHHRYVPDVSLSAAGHDGYLVIQEGGLYLVGGTSAAAPAFAGLMSIVDQYTGGANGNPNARFYTLATQVPAVFHDVTTGTNAVPCASGSAGCKAPVAPATMGVMNGYGAGAGYDLATGLGSVDAYALAFNWGARPVLAVRPTITSLSPNPMTATSANQTLTIVGTGFAAGAAVKASSPTFNGNLTVTSITATTILATINTGLVTQTWNITVTSAGGAASYSASLSVVTPATAPVIANLNPNPMAGYNGYQMLTINGSGFQSGAAAKIVVGYPGYSATVTGGSMAVLNATQIICLVNVGTVTRTWTVQVVNPSGLASNTVNLQVNAPPSITSLSPNPMTHLATTQTLTINGANFVTGAALRVIVAAGSAATTLQGTAIKSVTPTQIQVTVTMAAAGNRVVQVVNPDGSATNGVTLTVK